MEVMVHSMITDLPMRTTKKEEIRQATENDSSLQMLSRVAKESWPYHRRTFLLEIRQCLGLRDEIAAAEGLLFLAERLIIPVPCKKKCYDAYTRVTGHRKEQGPHQGSNVLARHGRRHREHCGQMWHMPVVPQKQSEGTPHATSSAAAPLADSICWYHDLQRPRFHSLGRLLLKILRDGTTEEQNCRDNNTADEVYLCPSWHSRETHLRQHAICQHASPIIRCRLGHCWENI